MKNQLDTIRIVVGVYSPLESQLLLTALKGIRRQFEVVACGTTKSELLTGLSRGDVDVALISASLRDGALAGLELSPLIASLYPKTRVIILLDSTRDDLIVHAFHARAKGVFCRSETDVRMLCKSIEAVHDGQIWANSQQLQLLLKAFTEGSAPKIVSSTGANLLAMRESQVAGLVAEGLSNREIARKLSISEHTVSNYLFRIYNKLGISSRVELVVYVMKQARESLGAA